MDIDDSLSLNTLPYPETPLKISRKRKHSTNTISEDDIQNGSGRKSRPPGTKRACNQCRQQKLKCNVIEDPWKDCDRCHKHHLKCEITADFKRIGKRSQQAELEKNNILLSQKVEELNRQIASYRDRDVGEFDIYQLQRTHLDRDLLPPSRPSSILPDGDDSHDAALLLNLKQSKDLAPPSTHRKLGDQFIPIEKIYPLWDEFLVNYHLYLPILDHEIDTPDVTHEKSEFLFWTIILIASRHNNSDQTLLQRLLPGYRELLKETICRPPNNHHVVKAFCFLCTWPPPVSTTTADMTFIWSGIMMKFAMQLGLHRPSHPLDFSRTRILLREEDVSDRYQTWIACNVVAQNVSTGYGQPPDTVYDATLQSIDMSTKLPSLQPRLEIEKIVDGITRSVYSPRESANFADSITMSAQLMAGALATLESTVDLSLPVNRIYANACSLHLRLFVFFEEPSSQAYHSALIELYESAKTFISSTLEIESDIRFVPNYIQQMLLAAAVALLKLLNSFFAVNVDREHGQQLFWDAISAIRRMSVKQNDLPLRLAEVFAQMWQADAERLTEQETLEDANGELSISIALTHRYRMSQSHVFDSIWRWKDEVEGKIRAEKLETAIKDPTSPQTNHRGSFSNNRPSAFLDETSALSGMPSFSGFGGMPLAPNNDLMYANSYDAFDSLGWYLDGSWNTDVPYPSVG